MYCAVSPRILLAGLLAVVLSWCGNASASTPDRNYLFGDHPDEGAQVDQVVGSNNLVVPNTTLDSQGPSGSFIDLTQNNGPIYADATARPFSDAGEKGIQFDGTDDYLRAIGLGNPGQGDTGQTVVYDGLFQRTIQGWVRPTDAGSGLRQDVFFDTHQFGIFASANDRWGIQYGQPGTLLTDVPVAFNTWSHVMHRTTGGIVIFYLNGNAVFAQTGAYDGNSGGDLGDMWVGAGVGGGANPFAGQLDDFQVLISGDNSATVGGMNYGAFDLAVDNDFVRGTLVAEGFVAGDVNGDGVVNGDGSGDPGVDDVAFFVDHWLDRKVVNGNLVGDLTTRTTMADLNFSGTTNLFDWVILRQNHTAGGSLNLAELLAAQVPEPGSVALITIALVVGGMAVKQVRRNGRREQ